MNTFCVTNPATKHPDVGKLQLALKAADFYRGAIDNVFSIGTGDACAKAKYALGYPDRKITHCGGQPLIDYLTGHKRLPAGYVVRRRLRGYGLTKAERQRRAIVQYGLWAIANEPEIHYAMVRPMDHLDKVKALPWYSDCSELVTTFYDWADAPNPNGSTPRGQGWTGTMLNNGVFIPLFQAKAGDVVIWGVPPGHHTALLIEDGTANNGDPWLCSHGSEGGPKKVRLSDETAVQRRMGHGTTYIKRYING